MADDTTQRALYDFLVPRMESLEPFSKQQIQAITGWSNNSWDTYLSKQFKGLFEQLPNGQFRLREQFRAYANWNKFQRHVTQVKTPPAVYEPTVFKQVIVFEFYLPLSHENSLRNTLDRLFFRDAIIPRLNRIGAEGLAKVFDRNPGENDEQLIERVCKFVGDKFQGYSIYHVSGRFRSGDLLSSEDAWKRRTTNPYLIDETTAVTRFVFPCKDKEPERIKFLFRALFAETITQQISGEDEVWMVESGLENCVHIWKPRTR
jgi:hypothetical protein